MTNTNTSAVSSVIDAGSLFRGLPSSVEIYEVGPRDGLQNEANLISVETKKKMLDWWGDTIYEYYAATEGGGTLVTPEEWKKYPGTVGKPWANSDIKIYDDEQNELGRNEVGTVYMLLGNADFEYKDAAKKTRDNRIGKYFTVGDVGELNDEGYLFLRDRKLDMIISGGANIYPAEIENFLMSHPDILEVQVAGLPDMKFGEQVSAWIIAKPGTTLSVEDVKKFCKEKIAHYKVPHYVTIIQEFPLTVTGKIQKFKLRDMGIEEHGLQEAAAAKMA